MSDDKKPTPGWIAYVWWAKLHPDANGRGGDRGALARLRRAETPLRALLQPEAMDLLERLRHSDRLGETLARETKRLGWRDGPGDALLAVGALAAALAHVRCAPAEQTDDKQSGGPTFAEALGRTAEGKPRKTSDDRPRLSGARFANLIRAADWDTRLRHLRRALPALKSNPFDVARFADDLLAWNETAEARWIFAYHQNLRAAPERAKEDAQ